MFPLEFRDKFGPQKTRIMGLPGSEDSLTIGCRFDTIPTCDGQTDRRTAYINNVHNMIDARRVQFFECTVYYTHIDLM